MIAKESKEMEMTNKLIVVPDKTQCVLLLCEEIERARLVYQEKVFQLESLINDQALRRRVAEPAKQKLPLRKERFSVKPDITASEFGCYTDEERKQLLVDYVPIKKRAEKAAFLRKYKLKAWHLSGWRNHHYKKKPKKLSARKQRYRRFADPKNNSLMTDPIATKLRLRGENVPRGVGRCLPKDLCTQMRTFAKEKFKEKFTIMQISYSIGVAPQSLQRWLSQKSASNTNGANGVHAS